DAPFGLALLLYHLMKIWPIRQHLGSHRPPDKNALWVSAKPVPLKLEQIFFTVKNRPRLLVGNQFHAFEQIIRHTRAAIRGSVKWVAGSHSNDVLGRVHNVQNTRSPHG